MLDGQVDLLDGDPAFLNAAHGRGRPAGRLTSSPRPANLASLNGDDDEPRSSRPDGTAYEFRTVLGAKTGTLPAGNGVWGDGNRCGFGISRFGAS